MTAVINNVDADLGNTYKTIERMPEMTVILKIGKA